MKIFQPFFIFIVAVLFTLQAIADDSSNSHKTNNIDTARLRDLDNSLKHHSENIIILREKQIDKASANQQTESEGEYSDNVLFLLSEINNDVEDLIAKQNLLGSMESEHGKTMVTRHKEGDTKDFKAKCGTYLDGLNVDLGKITGGSLTYEVKNARDDVVKICDIVQGWD